MEHSAMSAFLSSLRIFDSKRARNIITAVLLDSHIERFEANTRILEEGASSNDRGYIILRGSADVFIEGEKIATLGVGDIFGEYAPIAQRDRTATVITTSDITCLVLKKGVLLRLVAIWSGLNDIILHRIGENKKHKRGIFKIYS